MTRQRSLLLHSPLPTMILHLFTPALVLGFVEPRLTNITEEKWSKDVNNQTLIKFANDTSTERPNNVTFSLFKDEMSDSEDALLGNQTTAVLREDNERFQDQETVFPHRHCNHDRLTNLSHSICGKIFHEEMEAISRDDWCFLDNIVRPYEELTSCLEFIANNIDCYFPNADIENVFLTIHSKYFQNCTNEEEAQLEDAPQSLVIVLTIIPVSIIPVLAYLVVLKN